jgi:hypothetical protein
VLVRHCEDDEEEYERAEELGPERVEVRYVIQLDVKWPSVKLETEMKKHAPRRD